MRAVNLIPPEAKYSPSRALKLAPATYGLLGVLVAALVLVTAYVITSNTVSSRKAQIDSLRAQVSQAQSEASQLGSYAKFASLAQARVQAVRGIAGTRFDWHAALGDLAKVIPANTSLQTLTASVVPGASAGGAAGNGLRSDLPGPAFELTGCTATQDDVARLISRLRAMNGVTRVSLSSSTMGNSTTAVSPTAGSAQGCPATSPTFNLVVFYAPVPGAGPTGAASLSGSASATAGGSK